MRFLVIILISVIAGILSYEHFHSYILGFSIATIAVGTCHWFAFRSVRFPELAFALLLVGLVAKMGVAVAGVSWAVSNSLITSPFIFAVSYLFFSITATYVWFSVREWMSKQETLKKEQTIPA
ncbi:NADH:ubiquinone oxidoreductase [Vibrio sp.]|nr:NADH:ubiquinone oxidoreductase [Vibrio sp.]